MIHHVLFDADGVCILSERFSTLLARKKGVSPEVTHKFFSTVFQDCLIGKADLKQVLPPFLKEWGIESTIDIFLDYWFSSENKPNKKLLNHIQALRKEGIKCYLATNQEKYRTEYVKRKMGFGKYFDFIFSSANIGFIKSSVELFQSVHNKIGSPNKNTVLLVDDTLKNIEAAEAFGFKGILYSNFRNYLKLLKLLQ